MRLTVAEQEGEESQITPQKMLRALASHGRQTKCVIILDPGLSHGLERGLRLEINLEFSLIAVYRFRRGIVFSFIFMHKEGVYGGQRHEVSKPQEEVL